MGNEDSCIPLKQQYSLTQSFLPNWPTHFPVNQKPLYFQAKTNAGALLLSICATCHRWHVTRIHHWICSAGWIITFPGLGQVLTGSETWTLIHALNKHYRDPKAFGSRSSAGVNCHRPTEVHGSKLHQITPFKDLSKKGKGWTARWPHTASTPHTRVIFEAAHQFCQQPKYQGPLIYITGAKHLREREIYGASSLWIYLLSHQYYV